MITVSRDTISNSKTKIMNTISSGSNRLFQNSINNPMSKFIIYGKHQSDSHFQYPEWEKDMGSFLSEDEYKEFLYGLA